MRSHFPSCFASARRQRFRDNERPVPKFLALVNSIETRHIHKLFRDTFPRPRTPVHHKSRNEQMGLRSCPTRLFFSFELLTDYWVETIPLNLKATLRWAESGRYAEQSEGIENLSD